MGLFSRGSWLSRNAGGVLATVGGGILTATGVGSGIGIPMMGAGLGMLGSDAANQARIKEQDRAAGHNQEMAREQMRFQEQMSNSALSRSRQDAINAGYNPMLPGVQGLQASSPSGAMGKQEAAEIENTLGKGLSSAIEVKSLMQQIQNSDSQIAVNKAMAGKMASEVQLNTVTARKQNAEAANAEAMYKAIRAKSGVDAKRAEDELKHMDYDQIMNRINRESGTAANLGLSLGGVGTLFRSFKSGGGIYKKGPGNFQIRKNEMVIDKKTGEIIRE